jgi:Flp pilus assembly protein TadB
MDRFAANFLNAENRVLYNRTQMPQQRRSQKRLRWWEKPADDRMLFKLLRILLDKDALTFIGGVVVLIVTTPWVLLAVLSLAAAGLLCAFLIRFANRKQSSSLIRISDL